MNYSILVRVDDVVLCIIIYIFISQYYILIEGIYASQCISGSYLFSQRSLSSYFYCIMHIYHMNQK